MNDFYIRNVTPEDVDELFALSKLVNFINLPSDKSLIEKKVTASFKSFKDPNSDLSKNWYIFVLVERATDKIIGVSMIHAQHGTEAEPHFYLKVDYEQKFSQTINTGFTHGTLKLGLDNDGPTEIGGLVLHPKYRKLKLGKALSFVRFLYIANQPKRFKEVIHTELMPPLDKNGNAPLWEAIGRRFMNMGYKEADILSRNNKEFILSLFPSENIYMTLLPLEAREAIGKVGKETKPVQSMLESIGFEYTNEVDPFDGGPHYRARQERIQTIQETKNVEVKINNSIDQTKRYLVYVPDKDYDFRVELVEGKSEGNYLEVSNEYAELKGLKVSCVHI